MEFRPILSALLRNRTGAILIALQVALTMAVIINSIFIILDRAAMMRKPTGIDEQHLLLVSVASVGDDIDLRSMIENDIRVLENIDGVISASKISTTPLSNSGSSSSFASTADEDPSYTNLAYYRGDLQVLETLGLTLSRGRWFRAEEIVYDPRPGSDPAVVVLSEAAASEMFGDEDPVGRFIFTPTGNAIEVIGTVDQLARPWYNWGDFYVTALMPMVESNALFAIRVEPDDRERLLPVIEQALVDIDPERLVSSVRTQSDIVARTYQRDVAMNRMLTIVMLLVIIITALGIVGLASFSVSQRRRQIGTRRAVGARRHHVLSYFLVENWLIMSGGIAVGLLLSFTINHVLVTEYGMPKLDPVFLPLAVGGLWFIGLAATLGPARNAMAVDPAIATRNV